MNLQIGDPVYLVYKNKSVLCDKVKFIGAQSFILDESFSPEYMFDSYEWFFKDEDIRWSKNLHVALQLLKDANPGKNIEHITSPYFEEYVVED